MNHDTISRSIKIASFAVFSIAVIALLGGLVIPFNVDEPASVHPLAGTVEILRLTGPPVTVQANTSLELIVGQSVRTQPDTEAYITFELNQGRAILESDAQLTLVESHRHATSLGHALNTNQSHSLTLKQTRGHVRYIFANTTPPLNEMDLVIQLPDSNYIPDTPCWVITVDANGNSTVDPLTCPA